MTLLGLELEYIPTLHIIPHISIYLSSSIYIHFYILNFCITIKHVSSNYSNNGWSFYSPSITIQHYLNSAYMYTFEILFFHYIYRKGLFRDKNIEPLPYDNTIGWVHSSWLNQFYEPIDITDFIEELKKHMEDNYEKD